MAYNPATDFPALLRTTGGGVRTERVPGLDYILAALARMGLITLSVSQVAPTANQTTTAWLQPASPSWSAEGALFLWNATLGSYQPASPTLWTQLLQLVLFGYSFQSVAVGAAAINLGASLVAVQRAAPAATALTLPNLGQQWAKFGKIQIVDFSTGVAAHDITIATPDGTTIMKSANWQILSTPDQLAFITLQPSPDLNAWVIV